MKKSPVEKKAVEKKSVRRASVPVTVTFRHIAPTDALRTYAEKKLRNVARLLPGALDAHVVLSANKKHRHRQSAEMIVSGTQSVLKAVEETEDLYAAIDLAVEKLETQVRRIRGRVIEAPRRGATRARRPATRARAAASTAEA